LYDLSLWVLCARSFLRLDYQTEVNALIAHHHRAVPTILFIVSKALVPFDNFFLMLINEQQARHVGFMQRGIAIVGAEFCELPFVRFPWRKLSQNSEPFCHF